MQRLMDRRSVLAAVALPVAGSFFVRAATARAQPLKAGVNIAGAEFGRIPGRHGTEYTYPGPRHLDYYASLGMTLVRIPFRWERLQPKLFGAFEAAELKRLSALVTAARDRNLTVALDPHNYGKRFIAADGWRVQHVIGSAQVPRSAFADFWSRIARAFRGDDGVWFGLMNEPNDIPAGDWLQTVNVAMAAIRAENALNLCLVPGTNWTGAHSWRSSGNEAMAGVRDPAANFVFEVHQYFDANSSGNSGEAVSETIGTERIAAFEAWARSNGFRAFLGEFGIAENATSLEAGRNLLKALDGARDVWIGWAGWAGGQGWPDDAVFLLEPHRDGRIRAAAAVLQEAATRAGR